MSRLEGGPLSHTIGAIDCTPLTGNMSLLYGLLNQGEAHLIPTWLMREQRLPQVKSNQLVTTEPAPVQLYLAAGESD